ncbi:hypothetical protein PQX77_019701, partial [Marasmius sp. AFHP31]
FTLNGGFPLRLEWNVDTRGTWLSQAWSIFRSRGISLEEDLSVYRLIGPRAHASLVSGLPNSKSLRKRRSQQTIYLFARPLSLDFGGELDTSSVESVHYWSFVKDGHFPLPHNVCDYLGLPVQLEHLTNHSESYSWSNDDYKHLHQYQLLRGFDPATIEFAQQLGFGDHIFRPLEDSDWFEEAQQGLLQVHSIRRRRLILPVHWQILRPRVYPRPQHPVWIASILNVPLLFTQIEHPRDPKFDNAPACGPVSWPPLSRVSGKSGAVAQTLNISVD